MIASSWLQNEKGTFGGSMSDIRFFTVTWPSSQPASFLHREKPETWQGLYNGEVDASLKLAYGQG